MHYSVNHVHWSDHWCYLENELFLTRIVCFSGIIKKQWWSFILPVNLTVANGTRKLVMHTSQCVVVVFLETIRWGEGSKLNQRMNLLTGQRLNKLLGDGRAAWWSWLCDIGHLECGTERYILSTLSCYCSPHCHHHGLPSHVLRLRKNKSFYFWIFSLSGL